LYKSPFCTVGTQFIREWRPAAYCLEIIDLVLALGHASVSDVAMALQTA